MYKQLLKRRHTCNVCEKKRNKHVFFKILKDTCNVLWYRSSSNWSFLILTFVKVKLCIPGYVPFFCLVESEVNIPTSYI